MLTWAFRFCVWLYRKHAKSVSADRHITLSIHRQGSPSVIGTIHQLLKPIMLKPTDNDKICCWLLVAISPLYLNHLAGTYLTFYLKYCMYYYSCAWLQARFLGCCPLFRLLPALPCLSVITLITFFFSLSLLSSLQLLPPSENLFFLSIFLALNKIEESTRHCQPHITIISGLCNWYTRAQVV